MTDDPTASPILSSPTADPPDVPPVVTMSGTQNTISATMQQILDSIWECINDVQDSVNESEQQIRTRILQCIQAQEDYWYSVGEVISNPVLAQIGFVQTLIQTLPISEITPAEIAQRAGAIPWTVGQVPPVPTLPAPVPPVPAPRIIEVPVSGLPIGAPGNPGPTIEVINRYVPSTPITPYPPGGPPNATGGPQTPGGPGQPYYPPATPGVPGQPILPGAPGSPYSPGGPAQPNQPTVPPGTPYTPYGSGGGGVIVQTSGGGPGGVPGGPAGTPYQPHGYTPPVPVPPPPPAAPPSVSPISPGPMPPYLVGRTAAPPTPAAPAAAAAVPCPPVTVVIQCAPGTSAQQVQPGGVDEYGDPVGQQFIEFNESQRAAGARPVPTPAERLAAGEPPIGLIAPAGQQPKSLGQLAEAMKPPAGYVPPSPWDAVLTTDVVQLFKTLVTPSGCDGLQELNAKAKKAIGYSAASWWSVDTKGRPSDDSIVGRMVNSLPSLLQPLATVAATVFVTQWQSAWTAAGQLAGCDSPLFPPLQGLRSLLGVIETWIGAPFPEAGARLNQAIGQLCPVGIPSVAEANAAWNFGAVNNETWKCWVRANGVRDDLAKIVRDATAAKPSIDQVYQYSLRRGLPGNETYQLLEWAGAQLDETKRIVTELAKYVPGPGDLIRFMVRDVFDEQIVERYGFDEEFQAKWSGQALAWGRAQGMAPETAKFYWRAHWQLPSPTQVYQMLHRLRPGAVDDQLVTTEQDAAKLLEIDDYPKFWRDRMVAISYHPLTRIDTRRSYFIGTLTAEETVAAAMDLGYSESNARKLLKFWSADRVEWLLNRPQSRAYIRGELTDKELYDWIATLSLSPNQQDVLEQRLEQQSRAVLRRQTISAIKKRVVIGVTDWMDAQQELITLGYRAKHAGDMAQAWEELRRARGKFPSAQQLCRMYARGILDIGSYSAALIRLGYDSVDVGRIMALGCDTKGTAAVPLPADQMLGTPLPTAGKVPDTAKEQQRAKAALARAVKARNALSRTEESVQKRLTQTVGQLVKAFGGSATDYQKPVRGLLDTLTKEKCYTRDGASSLVKELVSDLAVKRRRDWLKIATDYFGALDPRPCPAPDNGGQPSTNGEALAVPQ